MDSKKRKNMKKMYVPPEIVREVFLRLPCKSLCRFRSVSKQYQSHIDDFQFKEEHRKRNTKASHFLMWDTTTNRPNLHLFNLDMDSYTHIKVIPAYDYCSMLPSSYGMVCLIGLKNKKVALFNPSSEETISLPDSPEPFMNEIIHCFSHFGFGFDPKSRRYKIVQLTSTDSDLLRIHILTVTRNDSSWRTVNLSKRTFLFGSFHCDPICCVDGILYWEIVHPNDGGHYIDLLAFDLGSEDVKIIKSPAKRRDDDMYENLVLLDDELCCYEMTPQNDISTMDIWKLKYDFKNNIVNWTLWYKLEIHHFSSQLAPLTLLCICNGKRIMFQATESNRLYYYDIKDNRLRVYQLVGNVVGIGRVIVHFETLNFI